MDIGLFLESKQAGLLLKTVSRMKVETTGSRSLTHQCARNA